MAEQLISLTEDDRRILNDRKKKSLSLALIMALLAAAALVPLAFSRNLYFLLTFPWLCFILSLLAIGSFLKVMKAKSDLDQGQKCVITGPIEAQDVNVSRNTDSDGVEGSATYTFWVRVGGQKLSVSEDLYYQLKKNDQVEAEIGPTSGIVFRINKFSDIG